MAKGIIKMKYRNPEYIENGWIDCEIEHPIYGWIPYTCDPSNTAESFDCKLLFEKMKKHANPYVPKATTPPSGNDLSMEVRNKRNILLSASDWTQLPDVPDATKQKWAEYRQALRDVTDQPNFPQSVTWPTKPS